MNTTITKEPVIKVKTAADIRKVVSEFLPRPNRSEVVCAQVSSVDSNGKSVTYQVEAPLQCDYRSLLIQGMTIVRNRIDAAAKYGAAASNLLAVDGHMWVDDLITRRLDGKRDGTRIRWDISEGVFYFDPFTGKLTQVQK